MICGNQPKDVKPNHFRYRSSSYLTEFFQDCDTDYVHDGSTRYAWVADVLKKILAEPQPNSTTPPATFAKVIRVLMDQSDACEEGRDRPAALERLNAALAREGYEAFYARDRQCHLRHITTNTIAQPGPSPHRPFGHAHASAG